MRWNVMRTVRARTLDDFSSIEAAFEAYGVVLDEALGVDLAATAARRTELKGWLAQFSRLLACLLALLAPRRAAGHPRGATDALPLAGN